jgi:hypothetical protein
MKEKERDIKIYREREGGREGGRERGREGYICRLPEGYICRSVAISAQDVAP